MAILEELENLTPVRCGNPTYLQQLPDILDITIVNLKENEADNCKRSCLIYEKRRRNFKETLTGWIIMESEYQPEAHETVFRL